MLEVFYVFSHEQTGSACHRIKNENIVFNARSHHGLALRSERFEQCPNLTQN